MIANDEQVLAVAKAIAKSDAPDAAVIKQVEDSYNSIYPTFIDANLSPEEADSRTWESLWQGTKMNANGNGARADLALKLKPYLKERHQAGKKDVTAKEAFEFLKAEHDYRAADAKGVGDLLGFHHFELESGKTTGGKRYKIPDPDLFPEWYDTDSKLPVSYYAVNFLVQLNARRARKSNAKFLVSDRR